MTGRGSLAKPKPVETRQVYFTMVLHPGRGWIRVGNAYSSRKAALEWLPFVRRAWQCQAKVEAATLGLVDGRLDEKSIRLLNQKFNLDAALARGGEDRG